MKLLHSLTDILRGFVVGLANLIPGVSGGTMMVAMGVYNKLIHAITNIFKEFKKSFLTLLPYVIGMLLAIALGSVGLKMAFQNYPLPTNTLFIGLILGSVPALFREVRGEKKGIPGVLLFIFFFASVIVLKLVESNHSNVLNTGFLDILKYLLMGVIASATMVIPGVSGSMILKTMGYYEPIVTGAIPDLMKGISSGAWDQAGHSIAVLLPFGIGCVLGIYFVSRFIDYLLHHYKGYTYMAVLGMVLASPVVTLIDRSLYDQVGWVLILISVVTFAVGFVVATKMGSDPSPEEKLETPRE